jgi:hypothetical protein
VLLELAEDLLAALLVLAELVLLTPGILLAPLAVLERVALHRAGLAGEGGAHLCEVGVHELVLLAERLHNLGERIDFPIALGLLSLTELLLRLLAHLLHLLFVLLEPLVELLELLLGLLIFNCEDALLLLLAELLRAWPLVLALQVLLSRLLAALLRGGRHGPKGHHSQTRCARQTNTLHMRLLLYCLPRMSPPDTGRCKFRLQVEYSGPWTGSIAHHIPINRVFAAVFWWFS